MTDVNDLSAGDPFADYEGKLEPDRTTCCDQGVLIDLAAEGNMGSGQNCPDCNPNAEQVAAAGAEWRRRTAAGENMEDAF